MGAGGGCGGCCGFGDFSVAIQKERIKILPPLIHGCFI